MKTVRDFNVKNKRVLVRCDFQVPLNDKGDILDDFKIKETVPTIKYLIKNEAKTILMSHLKPMESGKEAKSLKLILPKIEELSGKKIKFLNEGIGEKTKKEIEIMKPGDVVILENLRVYKEEEKNGDNFAKRLSQLGDIYINDAFGVSHRSHASIIGIPKYLPSGAGLSLEKETKSLDRIINNPQRPLVAIIGGAKLRTKTGLIDKISELADFVLIGGLLNEELISKNISLKHSEKIIRAGKGPDLREEDIRNFTEKIKTAKTIFWNGPLGKIEEEKYREGTKKIIEAIVNSKAFSVAGGGETVDFINDMGVAGKFSHISTGGGAMLAFLSGEKLLGIEALKK